MMSIIAVCIFSISTIVYTLPNQIQSKLSAFASVVLSHNFKSIAQIKDNYYNYQKKVRILIVPGHEPTFGGAEYRNLKERDMTLELGQRLQNLLESNFHYKVFIVRNPQGWDSVFADYFKNNRNEIAEWTKASRKEFSRLVSIGSATKTVSTVKHNDAPKDVALRLYSFTKWSNENNIDIVIHIHFNDNPRPDVTNPGDYSGFSIYVPAKQYGNSTTTRIIAENVLKFFNTNKL